MSLQFKEVTPETAPMTALITGFSGTGKTTVATSVVGDERFEPVLVLDVDDGLMAVAHKHPFAARINSSAEMEEMFSLYLSAPDKQPTFSYHGETRRLGEIKTVVTDSLTALRFDQMHEVAVQGLEKQRSKPQSQQKRWDTDTPQRQDYMTVTNRIVRWVRTFNQLGVHFISTVGLQTRENGLIDFYMNNALREALVYRFSYIWRTEKRSEGGDERFALQIFGSGLVKTRASEAYKAALRRAVTEKGFYAVPDANYPTLPKLYDLYIQSMKGSDT